MFKDYYFQSTVTLETIRYYHAYQLNYREIEEIQWAR